MTLDLVAFYVLAALLVATAVGMIASRKLVHGVLMMAAHFMLTGVVYLLLHAPFLAAVQVIVYAGAIMVLFLFVVMLIGPRDLSFEEPLAGQRPLGLVLVGVLAVALVTAVAGGVIGAGAPGLPGGAAETADGLAPTLGSPAAADVAPETLAPTFGSPAAVGELLMTRYVLLFEVVSILLLVAMIGAVLIGRSVQGRSSDEPAPRAESAAP